MAKLTFSKLQDFMILVHRYNGTHKYDLYVVDDIKAIVMLPIISTRTLNTVIYYTSDAKELNEITSRWTDQVLHVETMEWDSGHQL